MSGIAIDKINAYLKQWWVYGVTLDGPDTDHRLEIRVCDDERITHLEESAIMGYRTIHFHVNPAFHA